MIKYVLSFFSPDNMRVDVVTKSLNKSLGEFFYMCLRLHSACLCISYFPLSSISNLGDSVKQDIVTRPRRRKITFQIAEGNYCLSHPIMDFGRKKNISIFLACECTQKNMSRPSKGEKTEQDCHSHLLANFH